MWALQQQEDAFVVATPAGAERNQRTAVRA